MATPPLNLLKILDMEPAPVKKSLPGLALAASLVLGQSVPSPEPSPKLQPAFRRVGIAPKEVRWKPEGLHPELLPIAHLESSFGLRDVHAPEGDDYHTAQGALGLKPVTAHEAYRASSALQKLYPGYDDPIAFTNRLKTDDRFMNAMANTHWAQLKKLHGTPAKAAFAWRRGSGAASKATPEQIASEPYVQKYLQGGLKKAYPTGPLGDAGFHVGLAAPGTSGREVEMDTVEDAGNVPTEHSTEVTLGGKLHGKTTAFGAATKPPLSVRNQLSARTLNTPQLTGEVTSTPSRTPVYPSRASHNRATEASNVHEVLGDALEEKVGSRSQTAAGEPFEVYDDDLPNAEGTGHFPATRVDALGGEAFFEPESTSLWGDDASSNNLGYLSDRNQRIDLQDAAAAASLNPRLFGPEAPEYISFQRKPTGSGIPTPDRAVWEEIKRRVKKFEQDSTLWLAQQPLQKMTMKRTDLGPIARYNDDALGKVFVDDTSEPDNHPQVNQLHVEAFRHHVLDNPKPVKRGRVGAAESGSNSTGKVVYALNAQIGSDESHRYFVKPYHEKIVPRARAWMEHPIQGWAEMTNQALYHAAGIGHLHQRVHVDTVPIAEKTRGVADLTHKGVPALIVYLQPGVCSILDADTNAFGSDIHEQARKIGLFDFLSNNLDRHSYNLLYDKRQKQLLAIDHSRSFQYRNRDKHSNMERVDLATDSLNNYLGHYSYGVGLGVKQAMDSKRSFWQDPTHPGYSYDADPAAKDEYRKLQEQYKWEAVDAWNKKWEPVFDWWKKVAPEVTKAWEKRIALIKDKLVRDHVNRNFKARMNHLDDYVRNDFKNFGLADWDTASVPILRFNHPEDYADEKD